MSFLFKNECEICRDEPVSALIFCNELVYWYMGDGCLKKWQNGDYLKLIERGELEKCPDCGNSFNPPEEMPKITDSNACPYCSSRVNCKRMRYQTASLIPFPSQKNPCFWCNKCQHRFMYINPNQRIRILRDHSTQ